MIAGNPPRPKGGLQPVSVIGRLDGQVEAVLINPVGQRDRADEATSAGHTDAPRRPASGRIDTKDEPAEGDRARPPRENEDRLQTDALPVWLL